MMSIQFSKVTVTADDMSKQFLVGGIPRDPSDLEDCDAYEGFTNLLFDTCEVMVQAEAYLYGDGEIADASEDELEDLEQQLKDNPEMLNGNEFDAVEIVCFSFYWNTEELFGKEMED